MQRLSDEEIKRLPFEEKLEYYKWQRMEEERLKKKKPYEDDDDEVRIRLREREHWYDEEER